MQDMRTDKTNVTEHPGMANQALALHHACNQDTLRTACKPGRGCHAARATRLLVVDTQTCGSFMRANVSLGPPRHAAQLGAAGATHPAASNTCAHSLGQTWFPVLQIQKAPSDAWHSL